MAKSAYSIKPLPKHTEKTPSGAPTDGYRWIIRKRLTEPVGLENSIEVALCRTRRVARIHLKELQETEEVIQVRKAKELPPRLSGVYWREDSGGVVCNVEDFVCRVSAEEIAATPMLAFRAAMAKLKVRIAEKAAQREAANA